LVVFVCADVWKAGVAPVYDVPNICSRSRGAELITLRLLKLILAPGDGLVSALALMIMRSTPGYA
jgi:hypothetical protein